MTNKNNFFPNDDELLAIRQDGHILVEKFVELFDREGQAEMVRLLQQRGLSGSLLLFMEELFPDSVVYGPLCQNLATFANRCVLLGIKLDELLKDTTFTGEDVLNKYFTITPTIEELEKLWTINEE